MSAARADSLVLAHVERIHRDRPIAVLLRHAERDPLPDGDAGNAVEITAEGRRLAEYLGSAFGARLRTLHSSPVLRCLQTAEAVREGAKAELPIQPNRLLGDPGIFVRDGDLAWQNWGALGHAGVMQWLISGQERLPGMADPKPAAYALVRHMVSLAGKEVGIHLFVTHDSVLAAVVGRLLGPIIDSADGPRFLEGLLAWKEGRNIHVGFRESRGKFFAAGSAGGFVVS